MLAVRWYLRFDLSLRDVEKLLAERGVAVDHVIIYRWVRRFTPLLVDAARFCRHAVGDLWFPAAPVRRSTRAAGASRRGVLPVGGHEAGNAGVCRSSVSCGCVSPLQDVGVDAPDYPACPFVQLGVGELGGNEFDDRVRAVALQARTPTG